jgi:hypothetical protein
VGLDEDRVNIATSCEFGLMDVSEFIYFHPQWLHHCLSANANYRQRFAARAQQVLEGTGPMTPEAATATFQAHREDLELPIIAESARWGDAQSGSGFGEAPVMTKDDHWTPAVNRIVNEFFPPRTAIVIQQLRAAGLSP